MAQKILVISPVQLFPGYSGNRKRIRKICTELMNEGFLLDFFYIGFDEELTSEHKAFFNGNILKHRVDDGKILFLKHPVLRVKELFNGLMIRADQLKRRILDGKNSARYNKSICEYKNIKKIELLRKQLRGHSYKAVLLNYAVYTFYFDLFGSKTLKILDTHDYLSDRFKLYLENGDKPVDWHSLRYSDEKKAVNKADVIWAITGQESEHYKKMVHGKKSRVMTLRHVIPFVKIESGISDNRILLIGSDNALNIDGLTWFLATVWPGLRLECKNVELIVAGSICNAETQFQNPMGVRFYGKYDSHEEVYSLADICINPMLQGTGLKSKHLRHSRTEKLLLQPQPVLPGCMI
jgi:polysaccharide biosynthesis protein PslH